jgi:hypothetical protein
MADTNELFQREEYIGSPSRIRALIKILFDSGMLIKDRAKAYQTLSSIDPNNFPKMSTVTLVHSITKGKIAQSAQGISKIKKAQRQKPTMTAEYKSGLESVLFDPAESLAARQQAYWELSSTLPEEYPKMDSLKVKRSIVSGDIAVVSKETHPEYISPAEQKVLDKEKAKEEKELAKERDKKLKEELSAVQSQLSTLGKAQSSYNNLNSNLKSGLLDLEERRIELDAKMRSLDENSPTYQADTEYLQKHLDVLDARRTDITEKQNELSSALTGLKSATSYAEARQRHLTGTPEPDIKDKYTVQTWNKDGTLRSIITESRPSLKQQQAREAGEFAYVAPEEYREHRIIDPDTGKLTVLPAKNLTGIRALQQQQAETEKARVKDALSRYAKNLGINEQELQ